MPLFHLSLSIHAMLLVAIGFILRILYSCMYVCVCSHFVVYTDIENRRGEKLYLSELITKIIIANMHRISLSNSFKFCQIAVQSL